MWAAWLNVSANFQQIFRTGCPTAAKLCRVKSKRTATPRPSAAPDREEVPALPVWKAFVVQFSRETRTRTGVFSGRVEHVSSGRRAHFVSTKELLAALATMLDQLGEGGT